MFTRGDILTGNKVVSDERSKDDGNNAEVSTDKPSHADYAERALLSAIRAATSVNEAIHEMAAAVPRAGDPAPKDAPLPLLLTQPEGIARLMMTSNAGIGMTIEGMLRIPAVRAEQAVAIPGTQTVYLPGEDYPSRSAIEAIEEALRKHREEERASFEALVRKNERDGG